MFEDLSTFARIRIAVLSAAFVASLTLFVTGVPELPRAVADNSAIQPGEGGECPEGTFCAKSDGTRPACSAVSCCADGDICRGDWYIAVLQRRKFKAGAEGTCWRRSTEPFDACMSGDCLEEGADCLEGTCEAKNPRFLKIHTYEPDGKCGGKAL